MNRASWIAGFISSCLTMRPLVRAFEKFEYVIVGVLAAAVVVSAVITLR